jgi:uncharacterized protein (DUF1800 family)
MLPFIIWKGFDVIDAVASGVTSQPKRQGSTKIVRQMSGSYAMYFEEPVNMPVEDASPPEQCNPSSLLRPLPIAIVAPVALAACGSEGGTAVSASAPPSPPPAPPAPPPPPPPTTTQSARFLAQATMGTTDADIQAVVSQGFDGWLGTQFAKARPTTFWNWLNTNGYNIPVNVYREDGTDSMIWSQLITSDDQLRQRVSLALMEILVLGIDGLTFVWRQFAMAAYMDILWDNAFLNYRTLLEKVATSPVMGIYLTYLNSGKANSSGSVPDENFAREIMQLFSIGLYQLNLDGSQKLASNKPIETYTMDDIAGLARVFTGWTWDNYDPSTPDYHKRPMIQKAGEHELGAKSFLGTTIPAGTDGVASLKIALDTIFAHPNVAPFVSKQLIQRLVTSNPTPAYVQRVATVFENNGSGVRGDMRAVIRAILLDAEARNDAAAAASTTFGKIREPVVRFTGWARAYGAKSASGKWTIGNTDLTAFGLAQTIGRSPSVFNFFRPGYTPPGSAIATANMVAPEMQIVNEVSVIGYVNFIQVAMRDGSGDVKANFADFVAKAADSQALLDLINLRVAANQVSAATIAQIKPAIDSVATATPADLENRVSIATVLIMSSPEYLILK